MANRSFRLCISEGRLTPVTSGHGDVSRCLNTGRVYVLHMRQPQAGWEKGLEECMEVHGAGTCPMAITICKGGWRI